MQFDPHYKPRREGLPTAIREKMDRLFYRRRVEGLNVQFIAEDGNLDEWSFRDRERAEAFADNLKRNGREYVFSASVPVAA